MAEIAFFAALVLIALIAGLLAYVTTLPGTFRYERRTVINTPPDRVFPLINDFHAWETWSPWDKLDADQTRTYSGAASGPGAVYAWEGNNKVGAGRMEILESTPSRRVLVQLDFLKPFKANNFTEFALEPAGAATNVTWIMYGPNPFMSKVMGLVMNMDKIIGKDFETGLANIKAAAEWNASLTLDPKNLSAASVTATVDARSLDLDAPPKGFLDELRGPNWLDAGKYPEMKFTSTSVEPTGPDTARITGDFTMHGATKPVTLDAKFNGGYAGNSYDPNARIGFSAKGVLKRSDFGISAGIPAPGTNMGVSDDVEIIIEAEFTGPPWEAPVTPR